MDPTTPEIQPVFAGEQDFRAALWPVGAVAGVEDLAAATWMSAEEKAEYEGLHAETRRQEWVASRLALKTLLVCEGFARVPEEASVRKDEKGCPRVVIHEPDTHRYVELPCSISHSGEYVFVAFLRGRGRIGIDLEHRTWRLLYLRRKFIAEEDRMLEKGDPHGDTTVLWTFKEAFSKLLGSGWSCGFRSVVCRERSFGDCELRFGEEGPFRGRYAWFGKYALSVVWDKEKEPMILASFRRGLFSRLGARWRLSRRRRSRG